MVLIALLKRLFTALGLATPNLGWLSGAIVTVAAAFIGAWAAFGLENARRKREERRTRFSAGKHAQFVLIDQYTFLANVRRQLLNHFENDPDRWRHIPAMVVERRDVRIDIEALVYLLDTPDPNLLQSLTLGEADFLIASRELCDRNDLFRQFEEHRAELAGQGNEPATFDDFARAIPGSLVKDLRKWTDLLYGKIDEALQANAVNYEWLKQCLSREFPEYRDLLLERRLLPQGVHGRPTGTPWPDAAFPRGGDDGE